MFFRLYIVRFISAKAARHASSETRPRLNAANTGSVVAAAVCAAWVADAVALVDAAALIIAANASSIVSPVLIKRKYQNAHAHARGYIQRHYIRISLYNNARLGVHTVSRLSLRSIEFFSEHRQMRSEFTPTTLLCICIFMLNFIRFFLAVVLYFYVTYTMVNAYNSLSNIEFFFNITYVNK